VGEPEYQSSTTGHRYRDTIKEFTGPVKSDKIPLSMIDFVSLSEAETKKFGENFGARLRGGEILALTGNLGSGKTTFAKGLAKSFGVKSRVTSPTFVLLMSHKARGQSPAKLHHLDLYRLEKTGQLKELGLSEVLSDPRAVTVVEWPEKAKALLPARTIYINFQHGSSPSMRRITISQKYGKQSSG